MTFRKLISAALALALVSSQAIAQTPPPAPPVNGAVGANAAVLSATGTVVAIAAGLAVIAVVAGSSNVPKTAAPPTGTSGTH